MAKKTWTYKLRLLGRDPSRVPMARLAEYMIDFANLLGKENLPIFKGVRPGSTCLLAAIPEPNRPADESAYIGSQDNACEHARSIINCHRNKDWSRWIDWRRTD